MQLSADVAAVVAVVFEGDVLELCFRTVAVVADPAVVVHPALVAAVGAA